MYFLDVTASVFCSFRLVQSYTAHFRMPDWLDENITCAVWRKAMNCVMEVLRMHSNAILSRLLCIKSNRAKFYMKSARNIVLYSILVFILIMMIMMMIRAKRVPVTTACHVLRLRMEERPPIWKVAANILNKQSRTADKGWFSSLGVGQVANNYSP